jgi:hypothetical protein
MKISAVPQVHQRILCLKTYVILFSDIFYTYAMGLKNVGSSYGSAASDF